MAISLTAAAPPNGSAALDDAEFAAEMQALAAGAEDASYQDDWEAREALVAGPMALIRAGQLESGLQAFDVQYEAAVRAGASAETRTELVLAFALTLHEELQMEYGPTGGDTAKTRPYFRRLIDLSREAYGDQHDNTAYALTDYAVVLLESDDLGALREADVAITEAYEIRRVVNGESAPLTAAMLRYLGEIRGHPLVTLGDEARIAQASDLFEQAAESQAYSDGHEIYVEWGRMFARNSQPARACGVIERAIVDRHRTLVDPGYVATAIARELGLAGYDADRLVIEAAVEQAQVASDDGAHADCLSAADRLRAWR